MDECCSNNVIFMKLPFLFAKFLSSICCCFDQEGCWIRGEWRELYPELFAIFGKEYLSTRRKSRLYN